MANDESRSAVLDSQKEAVLEAVRMGCPRAMAAAAGDMTRDELREELEKDEVFAWRMEIARGQAGVEIIRALWGKRGAEERDPGERDGDATEGAVASSGPKAKKGTAVGGGGQHGKPAKMDPKVCMWLLENLILPRRTAAGSKAQGRRGQGDGEEAEDRVGLGTQRLIEALERMGIECTPPVAPAPGGPDGGGPQAGPAVAEGLR